ncbi:MAG TPA: hypothetical protein VN758_11360 [Solirubrobacterales bacterium]|nr:hypothetical protein [Solirubrobacterales bacterium]
MPAKSKELHDWLVSFPVKDVQEELAELEEKVGHLEGEIRYRRRLLEARNQALGIREDKASDPSNLIITDAITHRLLDARPITHGTVIRGPRTDKPEPSPTPSDQSEKGGDLNGLTELSRSEKLLRFLNARRGETWKLSDIRDRLIAEGLIEDSEADVHGLQVTASRLARGGRLERPGPGLYRMPIDNGEEEA